MDKELQTLIKELETERQNLTRLIDEAVKEQEFMHAYSHFESLTQIDSRLRILRNIEDEFYDQKYLMATGIENLRKRLETEVSARFKLTITQLIAEKERELNILKQKPRAKNLKNESNVIRDYLDLFVKKKVTALRIIISKSRNVLIEIRRTYNGVNLTIPNIIQLNKDEMLSDEELAKLKRLGFVLKNKGDNLTMRLPNGKNELTGKIVTVISIIVFEVFRFSKLRKDAFIEVLDK